MVNCAIIGYKSNNNKKCKNVTQCRYFSFPLRKKNILKMWIAKCGQNVNVNTARVCSKHFLDSDYQLKEKMLDYPKDQWKLNLDAIPSVNLPFEQQKPLSTSQLERKKRAERRNRKELVEEIVTNNVLPVIQISENIPTNMEIEENHEIENSSLLHSIATQTTSIENVNRIKELEEENKQLQILLYKVTHEATAVEKIFTQGQLRKLRSEKQIQWSIEDVSSALSLYSGGPRSYCLLRKRGYPLPGISTLRRWASKFEMRPGKNFQNMLKYINKYPGL
ncbi:hypothetical protein ABEB36_012847 [Hypothenemus hampei]|uniref:THAP-type domain-containing protein n=1 Tax=Hypothenemus hampei TaxID=57062 RepID=A0ABD1EAG5_HYPHA